jgi:hypothetical protein
VLIARVAGTMIDAAFSSEVEPVRVKKTRQNKPESRPAITCEIISLDMSVPQNPIRHIQGAGIRVGLNPESRNCSASF